MGEEAKTDIVYIYKLIDPVSQNPFYVGQSIHPSLRYKQHFQNSGMTAMKADVIKGLLKRKLKPKMEIIETVSSSLAKSRERFWIKELRKEYELINYGKYGKFIFVDGKRKKPTNYFLRDIPEDLLKEFKGACALKGTTMKDRIIELIRMDTMKKIVLKAGTLTAEDKKAMLLGGKLKWLFKDELKRREKK